jgi:hypothetical protein
MGRKKAHRNDTRRIPFVLNLADPVDAAIWEVLEPMLDLHRASAYIRAVLAEKIVGLQAGLPLPNLSSNGNGHGLPIGKNQIEAPRAKRPAALPATIEPRDDESSDGGLDALDAATDAFLDAFGR